MLTPKREAFAAGLAQGLTQAAAYRKAYPVSLKWQDRSVWQKASELAGNVEVQARVAELVGKAAKANEITVERVLKELARLAFFDISNLVGEDGRPLPIHQIDEDTRRAIVGLDVATVGNDTQGVGEVLKIKLADKRAALESIGKHLKMFVDRVEVTGQLELAEAIVASRTRVKRGT
jgi:phage terminase small subunit